MPLTPYPAQDAEAIRRILLASKDRASVGDFFVGTVVLHDPDPCPAH